MSKKLDYNTKYWNATAREVKLGNARFAKDAKRFSKCVQFLVEKRNGLLADLIEFGRYTSVASAGEARGDGTATTKFTESDAVKALPKAEQQLVVKQERVMNQLVDVLDKRIGAMMKREEDIKSAEKTVAKPAPKKDAEKTVAKPAPKQDVKKPVAKKASK